VSRSYMKQNKHRQKCKVAKLMLEHEGGSDKDKETESMTANSNVGAQFGSNGNHSKRNKA
jgi:hypothetical protein